MFEGIAQSVVKFFSETLSRQLKMLYERSERAAPFAEEQNAKLQNELRENYAKRVSDEKQRTEVFYQTSWS